MGRHASERAHGRNGRATPCMGAPIVGVASVRDLEKVHVGVSYAVCPLWRLGNGTICHDKRIRIKRTRRQHGYARRIITMVGNWNRKERGYGIEKGTGWENGHRRDWGITITLT